MMRWSTRMICAERRRSWKRRGMAVRYALRASLPLLALAVLPTQPAAAAPRAMSTSVPANVFVEKQAVRVTLGAGQEGTVVLRDLDGKEIARKQAPATEATLDFGTLLPGYYEASVGEALLPLVVVIDPSKRVPGDSRLATDAAMSWLVTPQQFEDTAELLRLAGFTWVRERLSWNEVERERGKLEWGKYDNSATSLSKRGIKVYQVFHSIPKWSRVDQNTKAAPDDLRDIYRFSQSLARQFKGRVAAWEVWNEPDISFFQHPASECAAFQKAAYLGFRSVDPQQQVLGPSMAHGACPFADHLLENGIGHYMDVWNYHIYADPTAYRSRAEGYQELLVKHGVNVPQWVTEAGDRVDGPEGILTRPNRVHQAAFVSRAFAQALDAGIERHFWFVFPFYRERTIGWGLFEPDERAPFPGYAAISTVTYALGHGNPLGKLSLPGEEVRALAFGRGDGTTALVVWREANKPAEVALPLDWNQVRDARTHVGTPMSIGQGPVRVNVDRAAVFLIVDQNALAGKLSASPKLAPVVKPAPKPELLEIVTRLRPQDARPDKEADAFFLAPGASSRLVAEVYNFGEATFQGEVRLQAPTGWRLDRGRVPVSVRPGDRAEVTLNITAPNSIEPGSLRLTAHAGAKTSAPAVVNLQVDPSLVQPLKSQALTVEKPEMWARNIAGGGKLETTAGPEGGIRFHFTFAKDGDNWAYPQTHYEPTLDLSGYDGLRFEYRTNVQEPGPVRVMFVESGDGSYMTGNGLPGSTEWRTATVLFSSLVQMPGAKQGSNGRLDPDRIGTIRFGANCKPLEVILEVRNVQAVKLR